jgi:hypothetical protein
MILALHIQKTTRGKKRYGIQDQKSIPTKKFAENVLPQ